MSSMPWARRGSAIDALHLGGGGFTMPRYIDATRPGSRNLVLELDPSVLATAREELGLVTSEDLVVAHRRRAQRHHRCADRWL